MPRPGFDTALSHWLPILGRAATGELRWLWRDDVALWYDESIMRRLRGDDRAGPFGLYYRRSDSRVREQQVRAAYDLLSATGQPLIFYYLFGKESVAYVGFAGDHWVVDDATDVGRPDWDIWYQRPTTDYQHEEVSDGDLRWWLRYALQSRRPSDLDFLYSYKRLTAAFPSHAWPRI